MPKENGQRNTYNSLMQLFECIQFANDSKAKIHFTIDHLNALLGCSWFQVLKPTANFSK